ncbi:MAG: 5-(carboxyamino)imidazole ribonucleotide mutase [Acidobacteria bacterium]|nr:5-(carboxyamino)imidazole ribonucleotide mutase [Acidobacteriota bacterium]
MNTCEVMILMGSASDWPLVRPALGVLNDLGVRVEAHVASAHRSPAWTLEVIEAAEMRGCKVFICAAGMAAHLAGVVASHTLRPVIGVPLPGGILDGLDALLATVQMPPGVPVATVTAGAAGARNAAYLAAQIVALTRPEVAASLKRHRTEAEQKVRLSDADLTNELEGHS